MACKLSENQISALAKYATSVLEHAKSETSNPNFILDMMKGLYDSIIAKTGDAVNALDYVQHIPTSVFAVSGANPEYLTKLVKMEVDLNKLTIMMNEFEDIDNVKKVITGNVKLQEIKNEIVNNELPDSGVIPTDRYNEIEAADATLKKEGTFKAKPETGFATFMQEAKNYDGVKKEDNIPDNDPLKVLHFRIVRMLNTMLSEKNLATADNLKLNNVKGIYYKLVDFNEIPEDNMYLDHKKYYENKSRGDKGVALILSDKDGNTLYFDNEGNISSKEDGGKMIYTSMRKPFVNDIYNVQKPAEIANRTGRDLAEVEKQRSYEIQILNKAREYAKNPNNASNPLLFSITQGSNGYILEDYRKQVQLSNLSFPTGFAPFISTENVGMMIKGGVYFQPDPGKNYPVLLRRPKFENIKGLTEGMITVLYDNKLFNSEKIAIIKQFVFSNSTAIYEENGKLFVKQKGEAFEIDNSTKDETSKKIAANLNGQIVNINGDLLNRTISIPVIENGKLSLSESSYNKFLAENFYTFLQPNADKSIVSLNAYNIIKPTETVLNTLLKQETQPQLKGKEVKPGIYVNQEGLTKEEQLELFNYLKPFLEEQAAKTNKGKSASKMIGLGLRWDYKSNNPEKQAINIPDVINSGNKNKYGYYTASINGQPLGEITPRFRELMKKATGVDMTHYDGAIINLYDNESFISSHNDVDESKSAIKYPVIGVNLGGTGNFSIESRDGSPQQLSLKAGAGYVFGINGINREVFHRTFPGKQDSFLPELTTKLDGKTYEPGSYRVSITMRRVMPLEKGMSESPIVQSAQQTAAPVTLENAVDTSKPVSKDDIFKALNALKRNTLNRSNNLINNDVTEAQIAAAKEWYDNSPLAKFAPYEVMFNIVNSDAWADFTAAGIRLYAGSTYADLYHEGWHAFSQLFLTVDQKKELYNEVRNTQPSLKNATDLQVEEHLAEDFRKYALAKGENIKSGSPIRNTLFRKIWNFLKSLFTGQTISDVLSDYDSVPAVRELYEKLYIGNLNEYRPSINNMMFTGLNLGITANANDAEQVLNYNDSLVVSDSIDSIMSNMLQDERNLGGVSLIFENEAAKNWLYLAVKNDFKEIIKSIQEKIKDQPEEAVQKELNDIKILQTAVDNWDSVLKFHKKKSVLLDFKQKVSDETAVDIDSNKDTETQKTSDSELEKSEAQLQEEYGKNVFESKGNEKSTREIASTETTYLIGSLHAYDKNGKRIANRFGIDKLADPSRTWGIVLNAVEGAVDDQDMYAKLLAASKIYPELKELANLLGDPSDQVTADSAGKVKLWTKFYRDFSLSRIPIFNLKVDVNVNGEVKFQEIQPNFSAVNKMMLDNYGAINNNYTNSNNKDGVHKTDVVKVLKDFKEITSREEAYDFLKAIGIELTNNQAVKEKLGYSLAEVKEIRAEFEKLKSLIDKGAKPLEIIYRGVPKSVITVLNIEAQYSGRFNNNARYNVNDDVVYDISLNNTISKLFKEFNDFRKNYQEIISQPHMRHLDVRNNPNAKYSIWLHSLFNLDETDLTSFTQRKNIAAYGKVVKNTIGLINIDGVKDETVGYGIKTTNLDPASKFLMDMHMLLTSGVQELMRHGDKSSAYGVRLGQLYTKFNDSKKTSHLFIDPNYFSTEAGHNAGVELILPKIAAELERIAILKEGNMPIIPGFNDSPTARGFSLTMFDDMLSVKTKEELVALANSSDSLSVITPELKQKISNELKSYFQGVIKENTDLYNEYKVMDSKVKNMIKLPVGSSKTTEEVAIEAYTYNAMIYNMESIALLYGDLALYNHAKDEFHKRNSSIGSTGRDFRASDSFYAFMATKNRLYAQSLGITDSKYQFNGILNTAVFQDSNVAMPSEMFEEYVNAYIESSKLNGRTVTKEQAEKALKRYKEINEGDGQGWITFDSYRLLKIAEGDWSDSQEELYKKIVNKEEISEADTLEFFPPYKVQYSGPLQSNKLQIQAFHKFSLAPLIPSVIKGTNMEILHNNMTRQNVDYGLFQSGSKLASYTKDGSFDKLYTGENRQVKEWAKGESEYTKNPVFIQYLKNQVDIAPTFKGSSIFSTQLRKLIINDIFKNGIAVNSKMGDLVTKFESLLDKLQENKTKDLLKEIGWNSLADANDVAKLPNLLKFVKRELTRQDLADNIIDFLDINPDGSIKYDLSLSLHADKIEKLLNAIVIKRLVKQKFNGEGLIQLASTGFENATEEQKNKYGASDLPTYHPGKDSKTTAMKVKIALQGNFKKLLNLSDVKKLSEKESISPLEALNKLIKDDAWMAKNNKLVTMVGVRIPVQGLNSMEFMEVYEFLPEEAGNAIIVPSELVTKSGGDFDIDKLTIFMPNISESTKYNTSSKLLSKLQKENPDLDFSKNNVDILIDANKNGQEVYEFNLDDQKVFNILKKNAEETLPYYLNSENTKGIENKIIENIREILEQPESFASLVTPNDTNLVNNEIVEELAKLNIHGYSGKIAGQKGISPTRVLEQRFNYAKMEENNIGKKMLGIGAVDNSYSSIFKRIGAHMGDQYTFYRVDKKGNITPQVRNIRMLLEHNTMTVGGKKVISLSDIETKTGVKVSDLISQLMNGWVDVAKDAWVFNINGNNIAGPVLLFMLEAGVDYETAVYLTTQPLVVDYVKEVYKQMSPFNTQESEEPIKITMGLAKYKAKVNMLKKFGYFDNGFNPKSTDLYKTILELAGNKQFTLEQLKNSVVTKDKTSDVARAAFAHFLELEETAKTLTNAKLKVNVDTAPSKSIVAAKKRLLDIAELSDYEAMPLVNKIFTDSPIKSFLIQGLQIKLFSPLMPLRFNDVVTDNIIKYIKDGNLIRTKFNGDIDRFSDSYKNDLVAYIFQNVIKGINFKKLTEYKGLNIKPLTVKNVLLKAGAFVKDGNLYLDLDQLKHDFETNAFAGQDVEGRPSSYKELGLHTLPAVYFKSIGNKDQQFQEYVKFVIEREILRSITKGSEEDLAKRALERSFNFYHNYKSKDSIANQLFTLKEDYAKGFVSEYSAFFDNILNKKKTKGDFQQLGLRTNKADSNLTNAIVENLIRLADPSTKKVSDVAENNRISRFFNRLIVSEVLRSGLTKTSTTIISVIPNDVIANILSSYTKEFVSMLKENPDLINSYNNLFAINAGVEFKNYVNYNSATPNTNKLDEYLSSVENSELLSLINYTNLKETLDNNQDKLFLFGNNANGIAESKETGVFQSASNTLAVPLKQKGGVSKTALWTDATYESNIQAINDALDAAEVQKQNGATLVIPSNGLNMIDGVNILVNAPKTYEYLVGELYKRFNFVTPGAETNLGFRTIVQENQDITDAEVNDILNKKFEESKKCNQ
jgi:hypothetical protein